MKILVYSSLSSTRLNYISSFIFKELLGVEYNITNDIIDYQSFQGLCINYSNSSIKDKEIWVKPHTLLFENNIVPQTINISEIEKTLVFFQTYSTASFPFDFLASSFYMLSRYEEYLPFKKDAHQRFSGYQSLAFKANFLEQPIIHSWVNLFVAATQKIYPNFTPKQTSYTFHPTYDIDIPWAFRYRGLRGWGRTGLELLQGRWALLKARYQAFKQAENDPFFCFKKLKEKHQKHGIRSQIFWLIANPSRHDINPNYKLTVFRNLIQETSEWSDIGLHPSYQSNENTSLLKEEKYRLETILKRPIIESRQHFLRLHLPQTYRQLIDAGIEHDHSMGFADKVGYRAGTSEPFLWYDLKKEITTVLRVYPFVAMDVTLKQYEAFTPKQAQKKLDDLQAYCQKNGLSFRTLWHNSSFSDLHGWAGWQDVYWSLFEE